MKLKSLGLYMVMVGMLFSASLAHAGQITATHSIVTESTAANGATSTTLNITVNNMGVDPIYNTSIEFVSSMLTEGVSKPTLAVGDISLGIQPSLTWVITTPMKLIFPGYPIMVNVTGNDALGNPVSFSVISH